MLLDGCVNRYNTSASQSGGMPDVLPTDAVPSSNFYCGGVRRGCNPCQYARNCSYSIGIDGRCDRDVQAFGYYGNMFSGLEAHASIQVGILRNCKCIAGVVFGIVQKTDCFRSDCQWCFSGVLCIVFSVRFVSESIMRKRSLLIGMHVFILIVLRWKDAQTRRGCRAAAAPWFKP